MAFREHLEEMIRRVDGAVAASVMGFDGIAIDTVERPAGADVPDVQTLLIEYTNVLSQLRQAAAAVDSGRVTEVAVGTERVTTVARLLSDEYLAVLALGPEANLGKARYVLKVVAPALAAEL